MALVPYTIIMIIPLSPPGHVFAFSLMKKCFPAAIPSPFTAQRQVPNKARIVAEETPADEHQSAAEDALMSSRGVPLMTG